MDIRRIVHGSPEYLALVEFRRRMLKAPLGIDFLDGELEAESCDVFLGAFDGNEPVASLVLSVRSPEEVQMRQVAVSEGHQRAGIGTALVRESERIASEDGFRRMIVSARLPAVSFYQRLGYELVGAEYLEVGIPHRRLEKDLSDAGIDPC